MLPLIFKRKKTAEFLRQNSGDLEDRKKHGGAHPQRPRTLEDSVYSSGCSQSRSFDSDPGSNPGGGNPLRQSGGVGGGVGGAGGSEGHYLSTGGGYSYYDYSNACRAVPQPRRSPSPVGSGEWALRECEVGLSVRMPACLFVYLSACVLVFTSTCLHVCLSLCLSACLRLRRLVCATQLACLFASLSAGVYHFVFLRLCPLVCATMSACLSSCVSVR